MGATMSKHKKKSSSDTIIDNRKARHDYFLEERFNAGLVLEGWEVKSLRAGKVQLAESHVIMKHGEAWLLNATITPLPTASTHIEPEPSRTRKLLLNTGELSKLIGAVERKGYTIVPVRLFWSHGYAKIEIALAKGKKQFDKRASQKDADWKLEKARLLKKGS